MSLFDVAVEAVVIAMCVSNQHYRSNHSYHHETYRIDVQWLRDPAVKFTRWQHPAMGCGARFASHHLFVDVLEG